MNRQTAAASMLPDELIEAYGERWNSIQCKLIVDDLKQNEKEGGSFGNPKIDRPSWMKLLQFCEAKIDNP